VPKKFQQQQGQRHMRPEQFPQAFKGRLDVQFNQLAVWITSYLIEVI